ncbi:hypothetical protein [Legionella saoudiensis]|uniref:hypothetical protein n=1 Tax=Legionella saoudiensis TaxID=1750561 RepID=UPI000B2B7DBF|nr:hypothetical protein [Legionella saoudiensis]
MEPDIIFIGAGPIGLLGAIQLKLQCPEINIIMFEKYEDPVRKHAMYVQQKSFSGMNRSKGFGEVLDAIPSKVIISDLEIILREFAQKIGIDIKYQEVNDFKTLKNQYPNTHYFVGSGGLRGIIHPQVFLNKNQINEVLRYAVEVKYKAVGEVRTLNQLTELPGVLANTDHVVSEYVGHLKDDLTPVSLRIFISEDDYKLMKGATFKSPYTLKDQDKIPADLYKTITLYLKAREHLAQEQIEENSLKISSITMSIYASKSFCTQVGEDIIFQLGEEAFACPFYRSFNDNACCVPYFTKAMSALFKEQNIKAEISSSSIFKSSMEDPLSYYQRKVQSLVTQEIHTIYALNFGLKMIETSVDSSRYTPVIPSSKLYMTSGGKEFMGDVKRTRKKEEENPAKSSGFCALM